MLGVGRDAAGSDAEAQCPRVHGSVSLRAYEGLGEGGTGLWGFVEGKMFRGREDNGREGAESVEPPTGGGRGRFGQTPRADWTTGLRCRCEERRVVRRR